MHRLYLNGLNQRTHLTGIFLPDVNTLYIL